MATKKWTPTTGDKLYLKLENKYMFLTINDLYGEIIDIREIVKKEVDSVVKFKRFLVKNINGKTTEFGEETFEKWFSNEPNNVPPKKKKAKDLTVSLEPTKITRRK